MAKEAKKPKGKDSAANDDTEHAAIDIDALLKTAKFKPDNLIGSVGDFLLQDLRSTRGLKPWEKLSEREQELLIERTEKQAREIVLAVVEAVAARGLKHMHAMIEDKGGWADGQFTLKVSVPMTPEYALMLTDHSGGPIQIVMANTKEFDGAMQIKPQADQPALIDGEDNEVEADEVEHDQETGEIKEPAPAR